jgi:hypothetical protein
MAHYMKNGLQLDEYHFFEIIRLAVDDEVRALREAHLDERGTGAFAAAHAEFHHCNENAAALADRLAEHGDGEKLPCTRRNLELVYAELLAEGKIKSAPPASTPVIDKMAGVTLVREDAVLEYQPPPNEAAALEKLRDDPALNDHQRKQRLRKLAALAGQQRRENSTLPRNYSQRPVL